jgi:predicted nucleic acid-binding protein
MSARAFLDTNVLVYLYDEGEPAKRARAREVVADPSIMPVISAQVLGEFFVTVTRKLATSLDPATAGQAVAVLRELPVAAIDSDLVSAAVATSIAHQLSYWDALILETARFANCEVLLTEDLAGGTVLRGVRIENPFTPPGR